MGLVRWVAALAALAAASKHSDCRSECKRVHRYLTAASACGKLGRTLAHEDRSAAGNDCVAAFNRGVTDECEKSCVAAATSGKEPAPPLARVFDAMGRPCTGPSSWDACRAGYEAAVAQTRAFFLKPATAAPNPDAAIPALPQRARAKAARAAAAEAKARAVDEAAAAVAAPAEAPRQKAPVEDVVVLTYAGERVPLVVREGATLVEAANSWCRENRPENQSACARALRLLAAVAARRTG